MRALLKILLLVVVFIGLSLGSYWIIFNLGLISGIIVSFLLLLFCFALLALCLYGINKGQLTKLRLTSRLEVASLLILTVYLSSAIGLFAVGNVIVEYTQGKNSFTSTEKTALLASSLLGDETAAKNASSIERNGVTYFYTASTEDEIDKVDELLQQERGKIASFFNHDHPEDLNIVFHDDFDTLTEASGYDNAMGFYDYYTQAIHMVPDDYLWDVVLLHEYTHYHSLHYAVENNISDKRLPAWFEEGLAEYLGGESVAWYELEDVEIIDFKSLNLDHAFHDSFTKTYDPYVQSYLAVDYIAQNHGEEFLFELFNATISNHFYQLLQAETGMSMSVFQEIFLDDMKKESKEIGDKFDAAYEAMDSKNYAQASTIIEELAETGSPGTQYGVSLLKTELYLMQEQFKKASKHLEERIENGDPEDRIDDMLSLAEVYLLKDPEKAWTLIKEVEAEIDQEDAYYYDIESLLEAYERVNSESPIEGYRLLLDEELLYFDGVIEKVTEKME